MTRRKWQKALRRLRYLPAEKGFFNYSTNKLKHFYLKASKSTRVAHPSAIMLEVTNNCNLRCITCAREYAYGENMNKGFMPFAELKKIVNQSLPYVDSIGLTGLGEPLLYRDLEKAVNYIRQKSQGVLLSISTNAHLPNSVEILSDLASKLDTIQISIDGTGQTYNQIRRRGDFDFFIKNTEAIVAVAKNKRSQVMFNLVVMKENYREMKELVRLAGKMGVEFLNLTLFNVASVTELDASYYDFFTSPKFQAELRQTFREAEKFPQLELSVWDYQSKAGFRRCPFPFSHFYITWDGFLVPCCAKPFPKEKHFGNVFEKGLMKCLNSTEFQDFRKMWFANQTPEFCKNCHMVDLPSFTL